MPTPQTYEVTAPDGRVFDVSGEGGPPTEAELEEIFRTLPKAAAKAPAAPAVTGASTIPGGQAVYDVARGAGAGLASTVVHGGDLLRRFLGMERVIDNPDVQALITPPESFAGKTGYALEQGAEFLAPTMGVAKAAKALPRLARWGLEGAAGAGVAGVQSGGEPGSMALAAVAPPIGAGIGKVAKGAIGVAQRAAAGAAEGGLGGAVAGAIRKTVPTASVPMLVQALKPRNTQINFPKVLETALPEIKAAERQLGKPIETVDDLIAAAKTAKSDLWSQYEGMAGPSRARGTLIDGDPIANAIEASIPSRTLRQNPTAARAVRAVADTYRPGLNMQEAEQLLLETNAELQAYYSKFPAARRASEAANPEIAHLVAEASELRKAIYRVLDAPGEGAAAREVKRRYGALMEVEQAAQRRSMVAARQQPESLSEQIGKVRAAGEYAKGAVRLMHGDLMGAANIAAARAGSEAATFLKEQQTTNALIRRALASHKGLPVPVPPVPQTPIRGLLPPGVTRLGPGTDPSDLPGITQRGEYGYREPLGPEPPPLGPEPPSLGPEPAPLGPEPAPYGPEPAAYGPEPPPLGPERPPPVAAAPTRKPRAPRGPSSGGKYEALSDEEVKRKVSQAQNVLQYRVKTNIYSPAAKQYTEQLQAAREEIAVRKAAGTWTLEPPQTPAPAPETPRSKLRAFMAESPPAKPPKAYKGTYYYANYDDAKRALASADWPDGRIVEYERGYAVQKKAGGTYLGPPPKVAPTPAAATTPTQALKSAEDAYDTAGPNADRATLRQNIDTAKQAVLDERARKAAPTATGQSFEPPPPVPIQSDPRYVKGTRSKAAAVVKPVKPAAPVAAPEQAAAKVTKQIERLIDVSGSKSAGEVRMRVLEGLQKELADAQQAAGFAEITVNPMPRGEFGVLVDGKPMARFDQYGRPMSFGPEMDSLKEVKFQDRTPTEKTRDAGLAVAAAFSRSKGAGQVVMRIPGDGVFTVERNPHAIQLLLDKIKKSSPQIWKDLVKKK